MTISRVKSTVGLLFHLCGVHEHPPSWIVLPGTRRSIATGINAGISINVDIAKEVGEKILTSMAQQNVLQRSFKKKDQAVTLSTSAVKVNNETIQIDPQLLFQRLIAARTRDDQLGEIFQFELCSNSPAIFESRYVIRPANKPALADAIWALMPKDVRTVVGPTGQSQYVLDGGRWCTEYRGSGIQPTMTYVDCT